MLPKTEMLSARERAVMAAVHDFFVAYTQRISFDSSDLVAFLDQTVVPAGFVPGAIERLLDEGLVRQTRAASYGNAYELTALGSAVAEDLKAPGPPAADHDRVPAADRFVTRLDNEAAFVDAEEKLSALVEAVRGTNDLFADADERLAVVEEVEKIRDLLSQAKVRAYAIWAAISGNGIVRWLADRAVGGVVATAAVAAAAALARIVGLPLPW